MSWRLARSLQTLAAEVRDKFPNTTIWSVGDADHASRPSDHNPDENGVVSAIDVVGAEQARAVWDHLLDTRDERVEYMIFRSKWTGSDFGWRIRDYSGANPHNGHCHVSVGRGSDGNPTRPDLYDDPSPWGFSDIDIPTGDDEMELTAQIQRSLIEAGYDLGDFTPYSSDYPPGADGDWGSKTEEAFVDMATKARAGGGQGAVGPQGPPGPKGDRGPAGPAGKDGKKAVIEIDYKDA